MCFLGDSSPLVLDPHPVALPDALCGRCLRMHPHQRKRLQLPKRADLPVVGDKIGLLPTAGGQYQRILPAELRIGHQRFRRLLPGWQRVCACLLHLCRSKFIFSRGGLEPMPLVVIVGTLRCKESPLLYCLQGDVRQFRPAPGHFPKLLLHHVLLLCKAIIPAGPAA